VGVCGGFDRRFKNGINEFVNPLFKRLSISELVSMTSSYVLDDGDVGGIIVVWSGARNVEVDCFRMRRVWSVIVGEEGVV
jgi:hypothetical protein